MQWPKKYTVLVHWRQRWKHITISSYRLTSHSKLHTVTIWVAFIHLGLYEPTTQDGRVSSISVPGHTINGVLCEGTKTRKEKNFQVGPMCHNQPSFLPLVAPLGSEGHKLWLLSNEKLELPEKSAHTAAEGLYVVRAPRAT